MSTAIKSFFFKMLVYVIIVFDIGGIVAIFFYSEKGNFSGRTILAILLYIFIILGVSYGNFTHQYRHVMKPWLRSERKKIRNIDSTLLTCSIFSGVFAILLVDMLTSASSYNEIHPSVGNMVIEYLGYISVGSLIITIFAPSYIIMDKDCKEIRQRKYSEQRDMPTGYEYD